MDIDGARGRMTQLLRSNARSFIDSQESALSRADAVALRNEIESLIALYEDDGFDAVAEFERRSVAGPGILRVCEEKS